MTKIVGTGCLPGQASGTIMWVEAQPGESQTPVCDRAAEILRFRATLARALDDLEAWADQQPVVQARLLLQSYKEALMMSAWSQRTCALIDTEGLCASAAAMESARGIGAVMSRHDALREQAQQLEIAARWLTGRLLPQEVPQNAILAAHCLNALEFLDLQRPALIRQEAPLVVREGPPAVWGIPDLGPEWSGRTVAIEGQQVILNPADERWLVLRGKRLGANAVCYLNGDPSILLQKAATSGARPAALVHRLDDLAAVPMFAANASAVAVNLDRLAPDNRRLRHPGLELVIRRAAEAARGEGIPFVVGGKAIIQDSQRWLALGCTGFFYSAASAERRAPDALRRDPKSGL